MHLPVYFLLKVIVFIIKMSSSVTLELFLNTEFIFSIKGVRIKELSGYGSYALNMVNNSATPILPIS